MDNISKKDMESVQGGGIVTSMCCSKCGAEAPWLGHYVGQTFDCPVCGEHAFTGIEDEGGQTVIAV